jgi:menaquinol-cytochrome c reductase iron-sulfur subunit
VAHTPAGPDHAHAYVRPHEPRSAVTRGQFLGISTVGLGAMIGAVIGVPSTAYLLAPVLEKKEFVPVSLGPVSDFAATGEQFEPTAKTFIENPQEANTSAALAWVYNTGNSGTDWQAEDAQFIVFSNTCMHLGCPVVASTLGFGCPCHGGQYDQQGRRTAGPPIRPLDRYAWEIREGDELWLTNRYSVDFVDDEIRYYAVKGPGQPVSWPGSNILYPDVTYDYPNG